MVPPENDTFETSTSDENFTIRLDFMETTARWLLLLLVMRRVVLPVLVIVQELLRISPDNEWPVDKLE
jgi:hypothetical protein